MDTLCLYPKQGYPETFNQGNTSNSAPSGMFGFLASSPCCGLNPAPYQMLNEKQYVRLMAKCYWPMKYNSEWDDIWGTLFETSAEHCAALNGESTFEQCMHSNLVCYEDDFAQYASDGDFCGGEFGEACNTGCATSIIGDGVCDKNCNNEACGWDGVEGEPSDCIPDTAWESQSNVYNVERGLFRGDAVSFRTDLKISEDCASEIVMCEDDSRCAPMIEDCADDGTCSAYVTACDVDSDSGASCTALGLKSTWTALLKGEFNGTPPSAAILGACIATSIRPAAWEAACTAEIDTCKADSECLPYYTALTESHTVPIGMMDLAPDLLECRHKHNNAFHVHWQLTTDVQQSCDVRCVDHGGNTTYTDDDHPADKTVVIPLETFGDTINELQTLYDAESDKPLFWKDALAGSHSETYENAFWDDSLLFCRCAAPCVPDTFLPIFTTAPVKSTRERHAYALTAQLCTREGHVLRLYPPTNACDDEVEFFSVFEQDDVVHMVVEIWAITKRSCGFYQTNATEGDNPTYTFTGDIIYSIGDINDDTYDPYKEEETTGVARQTFPFSVTIERQVVTEVRAEFNDRDELIDAGVFEVDDRSYAYWTDGNCDGDPVEGTLVAKQLDTVAMKVVLNVSTALSIVPHDVRAKPTADTEYDEDGIAIWADGEIGTYFGVRLFRESETIYCLTFPAQPCDGSMTCDYRITSMLDFPKEDERRRLQQVDGTKTTTTVNTLIMLPTTPSPAHTAFAYTPLGATILLLTIIIVIGSVGTLGERYSYIPFSTSV